ncbi:MAG: 23S rRNA (adenine(2030)-N(6))-methyltransferase RlmJ [Chromatiaceae bacterium]
MLSYRHAFHAGNHADVLKHLILVQVLDHLTPKEEPLCYIDTHAGGGRYFLDSASAQQNRELEGGIGRLWRRADLPQPVARYVRLVEELNPNGELQNYPGSPWLAQRLLRPGDRLVLFELHPSEIGPLTTLFTGDRRAQVLRADGLAGCVRLLPPKERRGLILIDPAYEVKSDYKTAADTLIGAHRRFATGIVALWYPVIDRRRTDALKRAVLAAGIPKAQVYELGLGPKGSHQGMAASGMVVVNPPRTLTASMQTALPWLAQELGSGAKGTFRIGALASDA